MPAPRSLLPLFALMATGCGQCGGSLDDSATDSDPGCVVPAAAEGWERDLLHMDLAVDLDTLTAQATITVAPDDATGLSLEAQGLSIQEVTSAGCALDWVVDGGALHVGLPAGSEGPVEVRYGFAAQSGYDGWLTQGMTFTWPYFCGNLFPCHSDPTDGLTMRLTIATAQEGKVVVYPQEIPSDAPSYMLAWATGAYERLDLGTSDGGVALEAWYLSGREAQTVLGTEFLRGAWSWLEEAMGPYPFGDRAGTVEVAWGPGGYGGMEHHPLVHVGSPSVADTEVQIHEAAHGWFGDSVRIGCWEDFVLSEGTVTYLTARALTAAAGEQAGEDLWAAYEDNLDWAIRTDVIESWPEGCGEVDILGDGLFSYGPYYRGAFFYRAYAEQVGVEALDDALGAFFLEHAGQATTMQAMIEHLHLTCGVDPMPLAERWLRTLEDPR